VADGVAPDRRRHRGARPDESGISRQADPICAQPARRSRRALPIARHGGGRRIHGVEYTASIVHDVASRYAVDGVHFDYVRYPSDDFDYSRETLTAFRKTLPPTAPALRSLQLYPASFADQWREFRLERLTALVTALRAAVKSVRPQASVSVAVTAQPAEAKGRHLQDWTRWLADGLVDVVCPSPYTTESATFASQLAAAQDAAGRHLLWAGIGAHQLSPEQTLDDIQVARRLGAAGIILFSYDTLIAPPRGSGYLSQLGKAAFSPQF